MLGQISFLKSYKNLRDWSKPGLDQVRLRRIQSNYAQFPALAGFIAAL